MERAASEPASPPQFATRQPGITALSALFAFGTLASGLSAVSLLFPGGLLEPMWRLNLRAHEAFLLMGVSAALLLGAVCLASGFAPFGLFHGRRWDHRLAEGQAFLHARARECRIAPR